MRRCNKLIALVLVCVCALTFCSCSMEEIEKFVKDTIDMIKQEAIDLAFKAVFPEKIELTSSDIDVNKTTENCQTSGLNVQTVTPTEEDMQGIDLPVPTNITVAYPTSINTNNINFSSENIDTIVDDIKSLIQELKFVCVMEFTSSEEAQQSLTEYQDYINNLITKLENNEELDASLNQIIQGTPLEGMDPDLIKSFLDKAINIGVASNKIVIYTSQAHDLILEP